MLESNALACAVWARDNLWMQPASPTIFETIFRALGIEPGQDGAELCLPVDVELDALVDLTTPVVPPVHPEFPLLVDQARRRICADEADELDGHPLPDSARVVQSGALMQLGRYPEPNPRRPDRLYVLEFQGHRRQYVMFGHTTNLSRRLANHVLAANPHGFALFQGWASPGLAEAQPLEQLVLEVASWCHGSRHFHERFYDMPFDKALSIGRASFELHIEWRGHPRFSAGIGL